MKGKRIALLIDSENISAKYMPIISEELEKQGTVTYKRIYGDWNNSQTAKWREKVSEYALTPIQQFRNIVGKNAIDSALIIDAMDILYTEKVEGFCIVSSDSDFTRLANRLRESGMLVIGMGEEKSPNSFRVACSMFVNLQSIREQKEEQELLVMEEVRKTEEEIANLDETRSKNVNTDETENTISCKSIESKSEKQSKKLGQLISKKALEQDILEIIIKNDNKGKITELGEVGSRLCEKYPRFKVKHYGYNSLSKFLEDISSIKVTKANSKVILSIKEQQGKGSRVNQYIKQLLSQNQTKGIELGTLGRNIHNKYQQFNVRDFGYMKLSQYVQNIEGIEIREEKGKRANRQVVYLQK